MQIANIVAGLIQEHKPRAVFIDAGRGEGVIDRLRQMGYVTLSKYHLEVKHQNQNGL